MIKWESKAWGKCKGLAVAVKAWWFDQVVAWGPSTSS